MLGYPPSPGQWTNSSDQKFHSKKKLHGRLDSEDGETVTRKSKRLQEKEQKKRERKEQHMQDTEQNTDSWAWEEPSASFNKSIPVRNHVASFNRPPNNRFKRDNRKIVPGRGDPRGPSQ